MGEQNPNPYSDSEAPITRLGVNLNQEAARAFKTLMAIEQVSATELERRMIAVYNALKECEMRGERIYICDDKGSERQFILLPPSPDHTQE